VVFVSHDRYFIDKLATRVFEVSDGQVHVFPGNYEDYLWRKQNGALSNPAPQGVENNGNRGQSTVAVLKASSDATRPKKMNPIRLRQMKERAREVEEEITRVEAGIVECEKSLQAFVSAEDTLRAQELLAARQKTLEQLLAEWEEISQALESKG
jgi:ATP-binding cassette subfamily F protein 3